MRVVPGIFRKIVPLDPNAEAHPGRRRLARTINGMHVANIGHQATFNARPGAERNVASRRSSRAYLRLACSKRDTVIPLRLYSLASLWLSNLVFNLPSLQAIAGSLGRSSSHRVEPVPILVSSGKFAVTADLENWVKSFRRSLLSAQDLLLSQYAYTVLMGVFFSSKESEAALLHGLGASFTYLFLLQVRGFDELPVFCNPLNANC